ncbi:MAG: hypothetical protein H0T73_22750 [Ardenticatenales bacterium]|nr:hypothetical protein [Ardenticatenales bacterium]
MSPHRPTLLAIVAQPGEEASAPGGTLTVSGWRGARTGLVTLQGREAPTLREAASRVATLLGTENHFHWNAAEPQVAAERLARTLRALQPTVVLTNENARASAELAWHLAADPAVKMAGLALFDPARARLWGATAEGGEARIDVSAARPLLRALRFYYNPAAPSETEIVTPFEHFTLLAGAALPESSVTDLFAGLSPSPFKPPISFLAEDPFQ